MGEVVKLGAKKTYSEALLDHLDLLTEEQANAPVKSMIICADSELGPSFTIAVEEKDDLRLIGLIETVKQCIFGYAAYDYEEFE